MNLSQNIVLSSANRAAPPRRLLSQTSVARLVTLWGAVGAVLVQTAMFGLVARLALQIDSAALPSPALSMLALALGALAMLGSKSLAGQPPLAAA
jgi:hypothetical protein